MTDREIMRQALDALELLARCEYPLTKIQVRKPRDGGSIVTVYPHQVATDAAEPLRERLAQPLRTHWEGCGEVHPECKKPEQEPVAWLWRCKPYCNWPEWSVSLKRPADSGRDGNKRTEGYEDIPLYTTPPRREWVGLTEEEIMSLVPVDGHRPATTFARAIEAKLKEKNNG